MPQCINTQVQELITVRNETIRSKGIQDYNCLFYKHTVDLI